MAGWRSWLGIGSPEADLPVQPDATRVLNDPIGSVARGCIERIISRAQNVRFKGDPGSRANRPCGAAGSRGFYAQLARQMLIEGYALGYREAGGDYKVAVSAGSTLDETAMEWHLQTDQSDQGRVVIQPAASVLFVTRRPLVGDRIYEPENPLVEIRDAVGLYEAGRRHQHDYADRGSRIGFILHGNKEVTNKKRMKNTMDGIRKLLAGNRRNYQVVTLPLEMDAKPMPSPAAPTPGAVSMATQEIARHFGVPMQMLQTDAAPTADEERVESRLLTDAVFPVLERISQAWETLTGDECRYDGMSVSLPTLGARTSHLKHLAQVRGFLVDEIRALVDYPPLPGGKGQVIISPAGGPEEKKNGRPRKEEEE